MEEEENLTVVSGDVENIIIKIEPTEDFLSDEDSLEFEGLNSEIKGSEDTVFYRECCSNETSFPSSEKNEFNIIQTPFFLESYFSDTDSLHVNELIDVNRLTCEDCKIVFTSERLLQEHLVMHIDIHRMGCNVCDKDLNMAEKFQLHVMAITRQSIYYCDLCKKSCAGVVRSKDQARPLGKTYACHDCEVQQNRVQQNNSSLVTPNICKIDNCTMHSGSSTVIEILQIHKEKHNGVTCNVCVLCPKIFAPTAVQILKPATKYNRNIELHVNGSKFNFDKCFHKCEHCDAFFAESFTLSRHVRERHNSAQSKDNSGQNLNPTTKYETKTDTFKCTFCKVGFSENMMLIKHLREEHESGDHKINNDKLNVKKRTSTKNKFKCNECNVSYSENLNLTKHLRQQHKKDKPKFTCKLCLKEFTLQRCFENHVNFHQITNNYVCIVCNLTFLSKYELQQHVKIHNGEESDHKKCKNNTLSKVNKRRRSKRIRIKNS